MSSSENNELNNELILLPDEWSDWIVIERIGTGSFGSVYLAQREGEKCAVKVIRIPSDESEAAALLLETKNEQTAQLYLKDLVENYTSEIDTMYSLQENPHIVRIEDHLLKEQKPFGYLIFIRMELLEPMREHFSGEIPSEEETVQVGLDICNALIACDTHRIIHRDIKPDNIFVSETGDYKLGDFGTARQLDLTFASYSAKGTFSFMAPEVYKQEHYNKQVDIYSLGIVLYRMMNRNRDPFVDPEKQLVYYKEREDALRRRMEGEALPKPVDASPKLDYVIRRACAYQAANRYPDAACMKADLLKVLDPKAELEKYIEPEPIEPSIMHEDMRKEPFDVLASVRNGSDHQEKRHYKALNWEMVCIILFVSVCMVFFFWWKGKKSEGNGTVRQASQTETEEKTAIGKVDEQEGRIPVRETGMEISDEMKEALISAEEIAADLSVYALEDKAAFESYFVNADTSIINEYYTTFQGFNEYENWMSIPVLEQDGLYFISLIGYKGVDQHRTDGSGNFYKGQRMFLSKEDGKWKINLDPERVKALEDAMTEEGYYPAGFARSRIENIENRVFMNMNNYMYLDETHVFVDFSACMNLFLWQEKQGDILVSVLFVNGTYKEKTYQDVTIQLNDKKLGTVLEGTIPGDITVPPRRNIIITYRFPKESVLTGTQEWEDITPVIQVA